MVNLGKNIQTIGELKAALKDIPDETLLNIGNRQNGFSVDEIYYDGISVAMETKEEGAFAPAVNADFLLTDASLGAIDTLVELCSDPVQKLGMLSLREMLCDLDMEQWYSLTSEEEREWLSQFLSCEPAAAKSLENSEASPKLKAIKIDWDVDYEEDRDALPTEIEIPDGMEDEEDISDYLSDVTGFCHKGFELVENEKKTLDSQIKSASARVAESKNLDKSPVKTSSPER